MERSIRKIQRGYREEYKEDIEGKYGVEDKEDTEGIWRGG